MTATLVLTVGAAACAGSSGPSTMQQSYAPPAPVASAPSTAAPSLDQPRAINYSGTWRGTTTSTSDFQGGGMGGAIRNITFDLHQSGNKINGKYKCYSGEQSNSFCRNMDESGRIDSGWVKGDKFQAVVHVYPDDSMCNYIGLIAGRSVRGDYNCYQGGMLIEQGIFSCRRQNRPGPLP